jgi:Rieske 2Fe-2S family protein
VLADSREAFTLSGARRRPRLPGLREDDDRLFYGVILRPGVFLILVPDHVAFFRMEPLAHDRTRITVDWLFDASEAERADFDPSDSVALLDVTNRQDFDACQRAQRGMGSRHYRGVLVPSEHVVLDFHDYYRRAVGDDLGAAGTR